MVDTNKYQVKKEFVNTDSGSVENELHFAFECQKYENLRENSNNIFKNIFQMPLTAKSKEDLLTHIMGNNDQVLTNLFSNFISKCFSETNALEMP